MSKQQREIEKERKRKGGGREEEAASFLVGYYAYCQRWPLGLFVVV